MSSFYDGVILGDSPVGFWPLNESSGTTAFDQSGNGNDGTYSGSFALAATGIGDGETGANFTGGQMAVPDAAANRLGAGNISIEVWINPTSLPDYATLFDAGPNSVTRFYSVFLKSIGNQYFEAFGGQSGTDNVPLPATIATGHLYHFVVTSDGSVVSAYINSVGSSTSHAAGASNDNVGVTLFGNPSGGGALLQGIAAKFAVYNYVLTPTQVTAHFAAQFGTLAAAPFTRARTLSRGVRNQQWMTLTAQRAIQPIPPTAPDNPLAPFTEAQVLRRGVRNLGQMAQFLQRGTIPPSAAPIVHSLSATQAQSLTLSRVIIRGQSLTQAQVPSQVLALMRVVTTTQGQSPSVPLTVGRTLSVTQGQTVVQVLQGGRVLTCNQGQSGTLRRGIARSSALTQGQTPTQILAIFRSLGLSQTQSLTPTRAILIGFSTTQGQLTTAALQLRRALVAVQGQTPTLTRAISRALTTTQGQSVTQTRALGRSFGAIQGQTAVVFLTEAKVLTCTQGQNGMVARGLSRSLSTTQGQTPSQTLGVRRSENCSQGQSATCATTGLQVLTVSQGQSATVRRALTRRFSLSQTQNLTLIVLPSTGSGPPPMQLPVQAAVRALITTASAGPRSSNTSVVALLTMALVLQRGSYTAALIALVTTARMATRTSTGPIAAVTTTASIWGGASSAENMKAPTLGASLDA